jgi:hypothetical protein
MHSHGIALRAIRRAVQLKAILALCLLLGLTLAACTKGSGTRLSEGAATGVLFSSIAVDVSKTAFKTELAEAERATMPRRLRLAMNGRFADRMLSTGYLMTVDISEFSLVDSGQSALGVEKSRLKGVIRIQQTPSSPPIAVYEVTAVAGVFTLGVLSKAIAAASESTEGYYAELIENFGEQARNSILIAE